MQGGLRITAANAAARRAGVHPGQLLADARTLCPALTVADADPAGDADDLERLALWCIRYTPWAAAAVPDGVLLDITGCAHLFGDEAALIADLARRLAGFGFTARIATAGTIGAAWAVSRHGAEPAAVVPGRDTAAVLKSLPVAALRLDPETAGRMAQVGLKTVGDLLGKPRAPLAARFGKNLIAHLDQALGHRPETLSPVAPAPDYRTVQRLAEPITDQDHIAACIDALAPPLARLLQADGKGARRIVLTLYRVDGHVGTVDVRTSTLCQAANHMTRLFREKLDTLQQDRDAGFGFEQVTLGAFDTETVTGRQAALDNTTAPIQSLGQESDFAALIDRYGNRLGFDRVVRATARHSHIPERAASRRSVLDDDDKDTATPWRMHLLALQGDSHLGRPVALLPRPELIQAIAEVPDGPPIRFEWRRIRHRVVKADGPERIAPEWWGRTRDQAGRTRDYFRLEDADGRRYWVYRLGLFERHEEPRWFMHGVFA